MKILITGATGYVGQNFITELIATYPDIEILTINLLTQEAETLFPYSQCKHIAIDEMEQIPAFNPEIVYHLATLSTSRADLDIIHPMVEANIEFGIKLLHYITLCSDFKLFVNIGSFAEYNQGPRKISNSYLYSATKSAFRHFVEYYANLANFKCIHLVPYTLYGGKDTAKKIIDYIRESFNAPEPVKMSKGEQILDFTHVKDLVSFFLHILKNQELFLQLQNGEEFHVGTGKGTSVRELAAMMENIFQQKCNADWGGLPYRPLDTMYAVAPIAKNIKLINWIAKISLEEGIEIYKKNFE